MSASSLPQLTVVDLAVIVSEQSPEQWPEEVLWPLRKEPVGIFGYAQIAMASDRTKTLLAALVETGLCASNGQARTAINSNAVMINRVKCRDVSRVLDARDALPNLDAIVIEHGKLNFGIVELVAQ